MNLTDTSDWKYAIFVVNRDNLTNVVHAVLYEHPPEQNDYISLYEELQEEFDMDMSDILLIPGTDSQIKELKESLLDNPGEYEVELHGTKDKLN